MRRRPSGRYPLDEALVDIALDLSGRPHVEWHVDLPEAIPLGDPRTLFGLDDLRGIRERLAAVLFELPQREIGGRLPDWGDLEAQVEFVRERGAAAHLDGARLWECTPRSERDSFP